MSTSKEELQSLCMDMKATLNALEANLDIVIDGMPDNKRGWKAASLRARNEGLALEKLGKAYRKLRAQVLYHG